MTSLLSDDLDVRVGAHRKQSQVRSTLAWFRVLVAWVIILVVGVVLLLGVVIPRLAGATPYTVLTGSMAPNYPPGTLVVNRPVDPAEVQVGDVVTYQLKSGEAAVVTHRVIGIGTGVEGEPSFLLQGDANAAPDPDAVRPEQIRGGLWYAVPHLGRINSLLTGHERQLTVYAVAAFLVLYAGGMFTGALRERRRSSVA